MEVSIRKLACFSSVLVLGGCIAAPCIGMCADVAYYAPAVPPSSRYVIDTHADTHRGVLEGCETVTLENAGRDCIDVVAGAGVLLPGAEARYGRFHTAQRIWPSDEPRVDRVAS